MGPSLAFALDPVREGSCLLGLGEGGHLVSLVDDSLEGRLMLGSFDGHVLLV